MTKGAKSLEDFFEGSKEFRIPNAEPLYVEKRKTQPFLIQTVHGVRIIRTCWINPLCHSMRIKISGIDPKFGSIKIIANNDLY